MLVNPDALIARSSRSQRSRSEVDAGLGASARASAAGYHGPTAKNGSADCARTLPDTAAASSTSVSGKTLTSRTPSFYVTGKARHGGALPVTTGTATREIRSRSGRPPPPDGGRKDCPRRDIRQHTRDVRKLCVGVEARLHHVPAIRTLRMAV